MKARLQISIDAILRCSLAFIALVPSVVCRADSISRDAESGPVKVRIALEPDKPTIGDIVTLTITVTAEKDVEVLMPEFGDAVERFTIVDFAPRQSIDSGGRSVFIQKYRLQTPASGKQAIPPILVEYVDRRPGQKSAPDGLDAFEIMTERLEFTVNSVVPEGASAKLKPALGKLGRREPLPRSNWPFYAAGCLVIAVAVPLGVRAWIAWRQRARRKSAYEIARVRLDRLLARPRPTSQQVDAFYVELSSIVRRYLEDRFDLRAPELTTEEFLASVGKLGGSAELSREHQSLLREFLRQADLVKFAGVQPTSADIDKSIQTAARFLDETRENAPLLLQDSEAESSSLAHSSLTRRV